VIVTLGREPSRSTLQAELDAAGIPARTIGSADRPGRVFDAIHAAFWTARLI
jgi:hypothetical protein